MKQFKNPLVGYRIFVALVAVTVLGFMLASPSEPGNVIIFGLLMPRLVLALGLLFALIVFMLLLSHVVSKESWGIWFTRQSEVKRVQDRLLILAGS